MKKLLLASFILFAYLNSGFAQCTDCFAGMQPLNHKARRHAKGNGGLNPSYLAQNVCGLNYVQASMLTETRTQPSGFDMSGYGFPAYLSLTGLPSLGCATVLKAYLYYGCTYTEATPPTTSATITNPLSTTNTISSVMVGSTLDNICWTGNGSATYRVDVTSLITGNGTYKIALNGFADAAYEVDGITLLVIYTDPSGAYSGNIALYDGDLSSDAGISINDTLTGFTACSSTTNATAFALFGDVQANVNGGTNTETFNGSTATFTNDFWNYCAVPTSMSASQSTSYFYTYTNNTADCYFAGLEGLYWQNTTCTTCTPLVTTMTLTTASAAASCGPNGSASVSVTGAAGPLTYNWSPGGQTGDTATGLVAGVYTVYVSDGSTCASDTVTVHNYGMSVTDSSISATCSSNGSASVMASGGSAPYTYSWSTGATSSSISAPPGNYTYTVYDNGGCTISGNITINNTSGVLITTFATPSYSCPASLGSASVYVYTGKAPYTYLWSTGQTTDSITGLSAGTYTVIVKDSNGCSATDSAIVTNYANHLSLSTSSSDYICVAMEGSASVNASGGSGSYTYMWTPGGQTTPVITGLTAGSYSVTVTDSLGCSSTDTVTVNIGTAKLNACCFTVITSGDSAYLMTSPNIPVTSYSWSPSASVTYPDSAATYVHPTVTTTYTITANTACGTVTDTVTVMIGCVNNFDEQICVVTVDTALNENEIIWGRTNSPPDGSYNIYKYDTNTLTFILIGTQPLTALSDYIDSSSNPNAGPSTYAISTVDSCGESALSAPHTSIYLTVSTSANLNVLNWSGYVGFTPVKYYIYRGLALNSLTLIDSVPYTTLSYHDTLPPASSIYLVEAASPSGPCIPHKKITPTELYGAAVSNVGVKKPLGVNNLNAMASNLNVYPNPGNGNFTLSYNLNAGTNVKISLSNMLGQTIYSEQRYANGGRNTEQLNLENLANGLYSLRVETDHSTVTLKVAIIK